MNERVGVTRLSEFKPGEHSLEDVALWGLKPLFPMMDTVEEYIDSRQHNSEETNNVMLFINEMLVKIHDTINKLCEYDSYYKKLEKQNEGPNGDQGPQDPGVAGEY